ncbi:MAG: SLC13 family permease [Mycobacterium sp.]|uniref:SLC13 family permease n=1 Tax=Mycobacterium sp. TaxID=1785 RepID=UPI003C397E16
MTLLLALLSLAVVLAFAVARPRGWPEAFAATPAVVILIAVGAISTHDAAAEAARLSHVVAFLGAVLVLAKMCDDEGLFEAAGAAMARARFGSRRLLRQVFGIAAAITAVLSLDATVVLLTPVVLTTVRRLRAPVRPHAYATAHLANAASLLLPVSNLTNLLAFHVANVSFTKFTAVMALPWLAAIGTVYLVFRVFFHRDLSVQPQPEEDEPAPQIPVFALVVVALTLAGFVIAEAAGVAPAWAALAGAAAMAVRSLARRHTNAAAIVRAVNIPFLVFVLALGVVVQAVMQNGVSDRMAEMLPSGSGLAALLGFAVVAAVLANVVNNLPATLVLVPLVAPSGPAAVLAVLIGVNIGPNLTYVGSLSNLLWRSVLRRYDVPASVGEYTRLGLCTVPTALVAAVLALWAGVRLLGL